MSYLSGLYSSPTLANLPPQMLSKSAKDKKWRHDCMDSLETTGRVQLQQNIRLVENYEMVKGKFIFGHYFQQEDYVDMIGQLTKEFELPSYLRHYDIISQVINTLSGEWQARPDIFRVKSHDEKTGNEYVRTQTDHLLKYVTTKIEAEVAAKMLEMGLDPDKQDFVSDEEAEQYQQIIQEAKKSLTPPQIQEYMKTTWNTVAEIWGDHQLALDKQRFRTSVKEKVEFEDMCVADRCFRHFYLTANAYEQETWNPVNTFYHKSPDVEEIERGDYVGRGFWLTISDIIDRYGFLMKKSEIQSLEEEIKSKNKKWDYAAGTDYVYDNYMVPFQGYPGYDIARRGGALRNTDSNLPYLDSNYLTGLFSGNVYNESKGYFFVIETYWKSQRKIGKVNFIDPVTGLLAKAYVDEDFVVPDDFEEIESSFNEDSEDPNTVLWTWVPQVWKGIKICTKNHADFKEDIYLDVKPADFQFKGDNNIYGAKLPVCGQVFSVRNSNSMSIVDLMKPHQIGHNVAMNQAYQEMQKDVGKFIVMDVNMFPDLKDWGGEQAMERFMLMAKELGATLADTRPVITQNSAAAAGGHMPREIDLDASARILSRLQIAQTFEQMALKQIGFNQYRLGQQTSSAAVGTVDAGQQRSFAQTESLFTNFSNYVQRCNKMNLDIAQYVQSQNKDITVSFVKSDLSRAFVKLAGIDLLLSDLHVYISNSQEEVRKLESLRALALSNNTTDASIVDLADIITMNSPAQIRLKLQASWDRQQENLQRQFQIQEQQIEQQRELEILNQQKEDERLQKTLDSKEEIAYIQSFNRQPDNLKDADADGSADILEYDKLAAKADTDQAKIQVQSERNALERNKQITEAAYKIRKLEIENKKIDAGLRIQEKELQYARIIKGDKEKEKKAKKKKA